MNFIKSKCYNIEKDKNKLIITSERIKIVNNFLNLNELLPNSNKNDLLLKKIYRNNGLEASTISSNLKDEKCKKENFKKLETNQIVKSFIKFNKLNKINEIEEKKEEIKTDFNNIDNKNKCSLFLLEQVSPNNSLILKDNKNKIEEKNEIQIKKDYQNLKISKKKNIRFKISKIEEKINNKKRKNEENNFQNLEEIINPLVEDLNDAPCAFQEIIQNSININLNNNINKNHKINLGPNNNLKKRKKKGKNINSGISRKSLRDWKKKKVIYQIKKENKKLKRERRNTKRNYILNK